MKQINTCWAAACLSMIYTLGILALSLWRNDGNFVYALDDPYIHLDLARQIATTGLYGVNPGEYAAPSSSIIWPFLLAPFAFLPGFVQIPFIIGLLVTGSSAAVITRMLPERLSPQTRIALAFTATLAFNLPGLALMGMENGLNVLLGLLAAQACLKTLNGEQPPSAIWPVFILLPLVRYESILISAASLFILFRLGWRKHVLLTGLLLCVPIIGFTVFLYLHNLGPVPSSTIVKKLRLGDEAGGFWKFWFISMIIGLRNPSGIAFVVISLALAAMTALRARQWRSTEFSVLLAITGALLGHILLGRLSTWETPRYDQHLAAFVLPLAAWLFSGQISRLLTSIIIILFAIPGFYTSLWGIQLSSSAAYQQQYQMGRLVRDFWHEPVAVNDIGMVGLGTDAYVLDLVGLANKEALDSWRMAIPDWHNGLVQRKRTPLIMVYRTWVPEDVRRHWLPVGELFRATPSTMGDSSVLLLTPYPERADEIHTILREWAKGLPAGANYVEYNEQHPAPLDKD